MKDQKNSLAKRLSQYSSFVLAVAAVSKTDGQVIYTDVDPDFSGGLGSSFAVDFNHDNIDDVILSNTSNGYALYALYAIPQDSNGVLGSILGNYAYPFALSAGFSINAGASGSFVGNSYANSLNYGGSDGNWVNINDKYLGVEFAIAGNTHYGWIRLDVNGNTSYVVKDFAYESTPGVGIQAGEGLSVESHEFDDFSFHPNPVRDNIFFSTKSNIKKISLYNLLGKEVLSENPQENDFELNLSHLESGVYLMEVSINGKGKAFKLIKE